MTREELRDYVDEQRTLNNIPYHVYSTLIDGIDTLEQEPRPNKPHIKGDYYDVFKNGLRTAEWRNGKIRAEIKQLPITDTAIKLVETVFDKYKEESE